MSTHVIFKSERTYAHIGFDHQTRILTTYIIIDDPFVGYHMNQKTDDPRYDHHQAFNLIVDEIGAHASISSNVRKSIESYVDDEMKSDHRVDATVDWTTGIPIEGL